MHSRKNMRKRYLSCWFGQVKKAESNLHWVAINWSKRNRTENQLLTHPIQTLHPKARTKSVGSQFTQNIWLLGNGRKFTNPEAHNSTSIFRVSNPDAQSNLLEYDDTLDKALKIVRTKEQLASNCNYIRGTQTTTVSALRTCPDTRVPSAQSNQSNKKSVEIVEHFTTKLEDHYTQHSRQSVRLVENTTEGLSLALTTGSISLYI